MQDITQGYTASTVTATIPEPLSVVNPAHDTAPSGSSTDQSIESLLRLRAQIDAQVADQYTQQVCIMMTDVVGSTKFFQKYGDIKGRLLVQRHNDTLFPLITARGGRVVKTIGDGIMAAFADSRQALASSITIQKQLAVLNLKAAEADVMRTKISLHYGSALVEANDIYGDLVNMSARINTMVEADQVLVSQSVFDLVKDHVKLVFLPLEPVYQKKGENSIPVYEVLWAQRPGAEKQAAAFRDFKGSYAACFYCGLEEHKVRDCPSKQYKEHSRRIERLGYLPTPAILRLFKTQDLNTAPTAERDQHIFEAFYEVGLPYQLRFLLKLWLANSQDWKEVERFTVPMGNALVGSRLWLGVDCLRVGRYDQAKSFLDAALASSPRDYKPHVAMGFLAMEQENPSLASQSWREALDYVKTPLQETYVRLLLYRLYNMSDKVDPASRELQRALLKNRYLHEAMYRQAALMAKQDKEDHIAPRLQQLIHDDRSIYLKVLLDPAFASVRESIYPLLTKLFEDAKARALEQLHVVIKAMNVLRAWYQEPEDELVRIEQALGSMRKHIKSDSYFGYSDAADESVHLQARIHTLLGKRRSQLENMFASSCSTVHEQLQVFSRQARTQERATKLLAKLPVVKELPRGAPRQFWHAWKELQALHTGVANLLPSSSNQRARHTGSGGLSRVLSWAVAGSVLVDSALFGLFGYLSYFTNVQISDMQLFLFLVCGACGGLIIGGGMGWLWGQRGSKVAQKNAI